MNCKTCSSCHEPAHLKILICEKALEVIAKGPDMLKPTVEAPAWCPKKG